MLTQQDLEGREHLLQALIQQIKNTFTRKRF